MIDRRDLDGSENRNEYVGPLLRWGIAAAAVVAAHAIAVWVAVHWESAQASVGEPPAAVMIDLEPLPVAPEAPMQDIAPGPQMTEAEPEPELPPPEPDTKMPELPQMEKEEAVVMQPPKPPEEKKPPKPIKREPEKKKKVDQDKPKAPRTTAPVPSENASDRSAAPASGAGSNNSQQRATWQSEVNAHLNRYKRAPPGSAAGTSSVAFTINRSGQVLSARLSRSSGDSQLDQEAVALLHRASPLPAPPSDMGASISLTLPVSFRR